MSLYGTLYQKIFWPSYEAARGRQTARLQGESEKRQWSSPEALAQFQWKELEKLLRHAGETSPWFRARFKKIGVGPEDIRSLTDFQKLPPVTREEINDSRKEMLSQEYKGQVFSHSTGGSTGRPLHFYINRRSYEWRLAMTFRGYGWAGCRDGEKQFYVWGEPLGRVPVGKKLKSSLHRVFLRHKVFSSFQLDSRTLPQCIRQINSFRPRTVIGYTNALYLLAQYLLEKHTPLVPPQAVITAAEGVNAIQRQLIEKAFGAPVFSSYGSREFMLIGMECAKHRAFHLSSDNLLVEVVRKEDGLSASEGELGEILVTDLHNFGMPFIRYKIGDMGIATSRRCPCGRGLPLLQKVEGRILDLIRMPDGRVLPGEFFPHLMKDFDFVKQFQVVQKRTDALEIKLVLKEEPRDHRLERLEALVRSRVGEKVSLNLRIVSEIPNAASGKARVTISEL